MAACLNETIFPQYSDDVLTIRVPLSNGIAIACGAFATLSLGFFMYCHSESPAKEHSRLVAILQYIGLLMVLVVGPIRDGLGNDAGVLPCLLLVLLRSVWLVLNQGPFMAQIILTFAKLRLQSRMRIITNFSPEAELNRILLEDIDNERKYIRHMRWQSGVAGVVALVVGLVSACVVILAAYLPAYDQVVLGCAGCPSRKEDRITFIVIGTTIIALTIMIDILVLRMQILDNSGIIRESFYSTIVWVFGSVLYFALNITDPGGVLEEGSFNWFTIMVVTVMASFAITVLYPALQTRDCFRENLLEGLDASFENLLATAKGVEAFEEHLAQEYSVENLKFYLDVRRWKVNYDEPGVDNLSPGGVVQRHARWIFETYLDDDAPLSVNISDSTLKDIQFRFKSRASAVIDGSVFDDASDQVFRLMEMDSFSRFLRSAAGKAFIASSGFPMKGKRLQLSQSRSTLFSSSNRLISVYSEGDSSARGLGMYSTGEPHSRGLGTISF